MGTAIPQGTFILSQLTGTTGGVGTYQLNKSFTFASGTVTTGAQNFAIDNCEFRDLSSSLNVLAVVTTGAVDNAANGLSLTNSQMYGLGTTAATNTLATNNAIDRLTIAGNYIANQGAANGILILQTTTTKVLTNLWINRNTFQLVGANAATGVFLITTATTHTGVISYNILNGARAYATAVLVTANSGLNCYENFYHVTADVSGAILPAYQT